MPHSRWTEGALLPRQVRIGDDAFEYLDVGAGRPLLFLHGGLGDWRSWLPHCAALSGQARCLSYTQRYFGASQWRADGPPFGVSTHADDLISVIEAVAPEGVALVAWSYAGHVALDAARRRPNLLERVLIYEPGVPTYVTAADELAAFTEDAQAMFAPVFDAVDRNDNDTAVRRLIDASGGPGAFERQAPDRRAVQLENAHTMPLLLKQADPPAITCADLAALQPRVSIAWGELTRPVFKIPSTAAARCVAGGTHTEVPGVGHLWPEAEPLAFSEFVARWLALNPGG
jgi:pimeloyl-ACP methyl ester carboxylesterase